MNTPPPLVFASRVRIGPNYGEAFGFLFKRPGGWQVLIIGGILLMFFWLIVPFLVVVGYGVALGRATAAGDPELPKFQVGMAGDGLRAVIVMFLYALPIFVFYLLAFIPMFLMSADSTESPAGFLFSMFGMMFFMMAYSLVLAAVQPALFAIFIADGTIGSCFNFQRIKQVIKTWGGDYAGAAAIVFGMGYLIQFGFIFLIIGIFFTVFYHLAFTSHVSGQLARPLITGTSPTVAANPAPPGFQEPTVAAPAVAEPAVPPPPGPATEGPHSPA